MVTLGEMWGKELDGGMIGFLRVQVTQVCSICENSLSMRFVYFSVFLIQ